MNPVAWNAKINKMANVAGWKSKFCRRLATTNYLSVAFGYRLLTSNRRFASSGCFSAASNSSKIDAAFSTSVHGKRGHHVSFVWLRNCLDRVMWISSTGLISVTNSLFIPLQVMATKNIQILLNDRQRLLNGNQKLTNETTGASRPSAVEWIKRPSSHKSEIPIPDLAVILAVDSNALSPDSLSYLA